MLKIIFSSLLIFTTFLPIQAQDTLYFDKDWKETTKEKHLYYRPLPMRKIGELLLMQDYYRNGQLQMQGYVRADNPESYVGDAYWYDEQGFDSDMNQHKNKSTVKELVYYHTDGSLWQKITYSSTGEKEKITTYLKDKIIAVGFISASGKFSGTFSYSQPIIYYESNSDEDTLIETTAPALLMPKESAKKTEPDFYFITAFWNNGNKASETKVVYTTYGSTTEVYKKHWDKTGKLLSERKYNNDDQPSFYVKQDYYTQNYFAISLAETISYKNNEKDGISIVYDTNGDTLYRSKFVHGALQQVNIFKNNKVSQRNIYQENVPYDGVFTEEMGGVSRAFKLRKGVKIDEEVLIETESSKTIARGTYKNGQPWSGSFYHEADLYEILSYENGLQNGVQRVYNNLYFEDIKEEYEMKNGIREGYRKIYEADNLIEESVYKNNQIVSGTIQEGDAKLTYVDGKLKTRNLFKQGIDNRPSSKEEFEGNALKSISYFDFSIKENPKASYTGYFRNEKPFDGYFKLDTLIDEIPLIDYYENGVLKYKYSFEFIEQLESYDHYTYTQKTSYLDDKVISGPLYKMVGRERLIRIDYADSKLTGFDVNLFAMHFFSRISFQLEQDVLSISAIDSPLSMKVYRSKNENIVADLYKEDKLLRKGDELKQVEEGSPNSRTFYYIQDRQIKRFSLSILPFLDADMEPNNIISTLYPMFPMQGVSDMSTLLIQLLDKFQLENIEEAMYSSIGNNFPFQTEQLLAFVDFDENGKISFGIRPTVQSDGSVLVEGIENNKVRKKIIFKNIEEMLANDKEALQNLEHKLLNDPN
ncbi:Antitoxin component YwqK of the YwqJK toxin-antitoxin module [Sphingobacterium nematocida]|uniref:Antitoxin component YwqK of the YwqJK toxin-antitoxin module n=1 Tax=Sphingobacterium nematocida TaxID=1513896 RepID=A0A1T5GPR6_9SPHI|nr:hypothetical protein [Sphingobacterium nematocida]SKC10320.1 Antitoxin component YwqK of the YwqJK toxin-antitoxin module [Sphingobacterium nematocida]